MATISLEKQAVSPRDGMVFCPLRYTDVHVEVCLGCDRVVRTDEIIPPRYVICDARVTNEPISFRRNDCDCHDDE